MTRTIDFYWSALGAALLLGVGCGRIHTEPGNGFFLTVPSSVVLVSGESPQMSFGVSGCDSFDIDFSTDDGVIYPAGHGTVTVNASGNGTTSVAVPSAALGSQPASCMVHLSIFVTCSDAHRTKSATFDALCAPKTTNATRGLRTIEALFPGTDALQPNWFADSAGRHVYSDAGDSYYGSGDPTPPLRVALASGATAYVEGKVNGQPLVAVSGNSHALYTMPNSEQIVDIAAAGADLLVLSKSADLCNCQAGCDAGATTLSRFDSVAGTRVVVAKLPGEAPLTSLIRLPDGRVGFATLGTALPADVTACVHAHTGNAYYVSDGVKVEKNSLATGSDIVRLQPNASSYTSAWVSDDSLSWVLAGNPGVVAGSPDLGWTHLAPAEAAVVAGRQLVSAAWLTSGLAIGYLGTESGAGGFSVDALSLTTSSVISSYEDGGASSTPALMGMIAIGDRIAVTTPTGLMILGSDGSVIGGADPLPTGVRVTAVAIASGPSAVTVAAGPDVFVFDVATGALISALPPPPCSGKCGGPNYTGGSCPVTCTGAESCAAPDYQTCSTGAQVLVADGLVGWWPGDGDTNDHAGYNNGVVKGDVQYISGVTGSAFHFDGSASISYSTDGLPKGNADRTVAMWAYVEEPPGDYDGLALFAGYGLTFSGNDSFELFTGADGNNSGGAGYLGFSQWGNGSWGSLFLALDTWYHVAVTYQAGLVTLYVNAEPVGSAGGFNLATSDGPGYFGAFWKPDDQPYPQSPQHHLVGALDDIRIYDRALSADELGLLASQIAPLPQPHAVTYSAAGSDSGSPPTDSSSYRPRQSVVVLGNPGSLSSGTMLFWAWTTGPNGTGSAYRPGDTMTMPAYDVALYPLFRPNLADVRWKGVAAGAYQVIGVTTGGRLWGWGWNRCGEVGDGTTADRHLPVQIGADTDWTVPAAGREHSVALKSDGSIWDWGDNYAGDLGDGTTLERNGPVRAGTASDWVAASAGDTYTLGIKSDGTLWQWGEYTSSEPVQISSLTTWASVSGSRSGHTFAVKSDGTLWHWQSVPPPSQVGAETDWATAAAGNSNVLVIKKDGSLWSWDYGTNAPFRIGSDFGWASVYQGGVAGSVHFFALKSNGTLWSWGDNSYGELGDGSVVSRSDPGPIGTASDWAGVTAGDTFTLAWKHDGTLWAWGGNDHGQLGDGTTKDRYSPVQVGPP